MKKVNIAQLICTKNDNSWFSHDIIKIQKSPHNHFLLKLSNTCSPVTLERNAFALQTLAQMFSFKFYNPINILESKSTILFNAFEF